MRRGCGSSFAAERSKLTVLQKDTSEPRNTIENDRDIPSLATGTIWPVTLGLLVVLAREKLL